MKKIFSIILAALMVLGSAACSSANQPEEQKGFEPGLDAATACKISVAGSYSNFEALEAEFDRFNEFYPNVELSYTKIDDYNNSIATVLDGNDRDLVKPGCYRISAAAVRICERAVFAERKVPHHLTPQRVHSRSACASETVSAKIDRRKGNFRRYSLDVRIYRKRPLPGHINAVHRFYTRLTAVSVEIIQPENTFTAKRRYIHIVYLNCPG